jgi:hypothetical protein
MIACPDCDDSGVVETSHRDWPDNLSLIPVLCDCATDPATCPSETIPGYEEDRVPCERCWRLGGRRGGAWQYATVYLEVSGESYCADCLEALNDEAAERQHYGRDA